MANSPTTTSYQGGGKSDDIERIKFDWPGTATEVNVSTSLDRIAKVQHTIFGGTTIGGTSTNMQNMVPYLRGTVAGTVTGRDYGYTVSGGTVALQREGTSKGALAYGFEFYGQRF